jgi:hypothetical protein
LTSCGFLINGIHGTTFTFPVVPLPDNTFSGWTDLTLQEDISSVRSATLVAVTLSVGGPAGTPDLSFLESLTGSAVTAQATTLVVSRNGFPKGAPYVTLRNDYVGDLHPLFQDAHTIHIDWAGSLNASYPNWPPDGFEVQADVEIDIEQ